MKRVLLIFMLAYSLIIVFVKPNNPKVGSIIISLFRVVPARPITDAKIDIASLHSNVKNHERENQMVF